MKIAVAGTGYVGLSNAIILVKCSSKGPAFFNRKRICKNKKTFNILKFRTKRIDTPKDVPSHMLENPEIYIAKIGKFLRKALPDRIHQAFNIIAGHMSIVGSRPSLWNQDDIVVERDKHYANNLRPGLSGWVQCSGRDTLSIVEKAKLDGEYVKNLMSGLILA